MASAMKDVNWRTSKVIEDLTEVTDLISSEEPIIGCINVVTALQLIQSIIVVSSALVGVLSADSFSQITGIIVAKFKLIDDVTIIDDGKPACLLYTSPSPRD